MKKPLACLAVILAVLALAGCGVKDPGQTVPKVDSPAAKTEPVEKKPDLSVSTGTGKSTNLPQGYPREKFPLYEGSYIYTVFELDGSYTITAFSKDEVEKVMAFYAGILSEANVNMETRTDESITSFGTKDGFTYNLDVGKSSEMAGYQTSIVIFLQPQR